MTAKLWLLAGLALVGGLAVSFLINFQGEDATDVALESYSLTDLNGQQQSLDKWQGKVLLVNYWATWCPPCIEEIPLFIQLKDRFSAAGLEIIGISIDEDHKAREFSEKMKINYSLLSGQANGMAMMTSMGNRNGGLPFSVMFDRDRKIVHRKTGAFSHEELVKLVEDTL
jgi:peroxiredoxin